MKRFEFNLQAVLTLRQREEQKAQKVYARELSNREQAAVHLKEVENEVTSARNDAREQVRMGCPAFKLVQTQSSLSKLSERRDRCARQLQDTERRVHAALQTMLLLRQKRRIVDLYHDKRRAEYAQEIVRAEQKQSDELSGRKTRNFSTHFSSSL